MKLPQRRQIHKERARDAWISVQIRINVFSRDEWPEKYLLDTENCSIGEEESLITVIALAWSPLGLAKHKRPLLAVLTSNHLLSLWASTSEMAVASSWERVFIINWIACNRHLPSTLASLRCVNESVDVEEQPLLRLRCMAWAPLLNLDDVKPPRGAHEADHMELDGDQRTKTQVNGLNPPTHTTEFVETFPDEMALTLETQLLAVANDGGNIYIIEIGSTYTGHSQSWSANIVQRITDLDTRRAAAALSDEQHIDAYISTNAFKTQNAQSRDSARPSLLAAAVERKVYVESVLWGPWRINQNSTAEATISTIRTGVSSHTCLSVRFAESGIAYQLADSLVRVSDLLKPLSGAAIWCQVVSLRLLSSELTKGSQFEDEHPIFANADQDRIDIAVNEFDALRHIATERLSWRKTSGQPIDETDGQQFTAAPAIWDPIHGV